MVPRGLKLFHFTSIYKIAECMKKITRKALHEIQFNDLIVCQQYETGQQIYNIRIKN